MYDISIKQDSCITTIYKKNMFLAYKGGGGIIRG